MKNFLKISPFLLLLFFNSCITEFIPKTTRDQNILVVGGLITDQPATYTIKLSKSLPLGSTTYSKPYTGCLVSISDDLGSTFDFKESSDGNYTSDSSVFRGAPGHFYTLHINTNSGSQSSIYESLPMEMKPVPPIDSVYYERQVLSSSPDGTIVEEGCQVYLDTHDPTNTCKFYRWEYTETWEFHLPYNTPNRVCWVSNNSDAINIKNASILSENIVDKHPINNISNLTDRLSQKYSILVHQYSMNDDEHQYWEKVQNISDQVGGLYDMIPSSIPSNVYCKNDPGQPVLGFFSVSAESSKRIFIDGFFAGIKTPYNTQTCVDDTIFGNGPIRYENISLWVIISHSLPPPSYMVITRQHSCYDCTLRGTNVMPDFWNKDK